MRRMLLAAAVLAACAPAVAPAPVAPALVAAGADAGCRSAPHVEPAEGFRRLRDRVYAAFGAPRHRVVDLIAAAGDPSQTLAGRLAYGEIDKGSEGEDVELFACEAGAWRRLGRARTGADGRFALVLRGAARLGVGLRDVYASATADRTAARGLAYVAPRGTRIVVTDVDGTLTASENAFPEALATGREVAAQPGAAAALRGAGLPVIYVSSRGDQLTAATRRWLATHGFPRGPLRLAPAALVGPGDDTVAFKSAVVRALASRFAIADAIGNRASDIAAYLFAGVPRDHVFIELPEFAAEVADELARGDAVGFTRYAQLHLR